MDYDDRRQLNQAIADLNRALDRDNIDDVRPRNDIECAKQHLQAILDRYPAPVVEPC